MFQHRAVFRIILILFMATPLLGSLNAYCQEITEAKGEHFIEEIIRKAILKSLDRLELDSELSNIIAKEIIRQSAKAPRVRQGLPLSKQFGSIFIVLYEKSVTNAKSSDSTIGDDTPITLVRMPSNSSVEGKVIVVIHRVGESIVPDHVSFQISKKNEVDFEVVDIPKDKGVK